MKTQAITPARIDWDPQGPPRAPDFDDLYHPRIGALAQARHVFIAGNGLPGRWAGQRSFVILETGFGLGNNFLATWDAWRNDPQRCKRLIYVAIELHPPTRGDLARAHHASPCPSLAAELVAAWPPLTANLHPLLFEGGQLQLLLCFGDVRALLPELQVQADAFYLDGFAPARNPAMWEPRLIKMLARRAAPRATAATWSVARGLREALVSAGFEVELGPGFGDKREITLARFAPPFTPRRRLAPIAKPTAHETLVIGAGLAGAFVAQALALRGWSVTVVDRHASPALSSSGNLAGLYHGTVHDGDGAHARLFRAAALSAERVLRPLIDGGAVQGGTRGLLRLDDGEGGLARMRDIVQAQGLPREYVSVLDAAQASAMAQVALTHPAWFYPGGGWVNPAALVRHLLDQPAIRFVGHRQAAALRCEGSEWVLTDPDHAVIARAPVVVLANAEGAAPLLAALGHAPWPLQRWRGQVSTLSRAAGLALPGLPSLPIAGAGYVIPLPDGGLLCGASSSENNDRPELRRSDNKANLERLAALIGLPPMADDLSWGGRVGWRVQATDRLPIVGPLPLPPSEMPSAIRLDQARLIPRTPGLFVTTAFGGRGITLAPLAGQLLAAQISGEPLPLEQGLIDAIDPARWLVRAARRAG